MAELAMLADR